MRKKVFFLIGIAVLVNITILMANPSFFKNHQAVTKTDEAPINNAKPSADTKLPVDLSDKKVIYKDKVVVLVFHHIDSKEVLGVTISPERFASDLDMLQAKGYNAISLNLLRQFLKGGQVPNNAVLITFDDGYESAYKYALPELKKRNMPAVNFVIGSYLNEKIGALQYLTWDEMKEMSAAGFTIQSHTYDMHKEGRLANGKTGPLLSGPSMGQSPNDFSNAVYQDLKRSKDEIENYLQQPVYALALPYGSASKQAVQAASKAGLELVFTGQAGVVTHHSNPLALPRLIAGSPSISTKDLDARIQRFGRSLFS